MKPLSLDELQKLPHKWWKKNQSYKPATEDILVELDYYDTTVTVNYKLPHYYNQRKKYLLALANLTLHPHVTPTRFDWFYAINTELLEFIQAPNFVEREDEMADVAIFCALCLKYYYGYDVKDLIVLPATTKLVSLGPIYNWLPNIKQQLIDTLLWALQTPKLLQKIEYNQRRIDHDSFGC